MSNSGKHIVAATDGPWHFEQGKSALELARLQGKTLDPHEGYFRENDGSWIITYGDPDDMESDCGQVCRVTFQGKAKRGEAWQAPDPVGQATARLIAAAPELLSALTALVYSFETHRPKQLWDDARAAIAKALGHAT